MTTGGDTEYDLQSIRDAPGKQGGMFDYQPGDSFLHRMNPLTKLSITVSFVAVSLLSPSFRIPSVLFAVVSLGAILSGVFWKVGRFLGGLALPLAASLLFFHGLFNPDNETVLFVLGGVPIVDRIVVWEEGIRFALTILMPLLVLMVAVLTTVMTTHPRKLSNSLVERGLSPRFAYVFLAALQFIPDMRIKADDILDAQQARGLDVKSNIRRRIRAFVDLLTPLLIGMLITSETRSLALESRGFTRTNNPSFLLEVEDRPIDRILRWIAGLLVLAAIAWWVIAWF